MEIALIAHDRKKELLAQFCIAYTEILKKHNLCATATTAKYVADSTGLRIERLLIGDFGGEQQVVSRISCNEIDCLLCFRDTSENSAHDESIQTMLRLCDVHNIPFATNIATAEALIRAIDSGDFDWREFVNPMYKGRG